MQVSPRPDGTGLDVGLHGLPADLTPQQARQLVPALDSAVPLSVTTTGGVSFTTRLYDSPPFRGGSFVYRRANDNACTSAFGVTGLNGTATYLLSAAHCGEGTQGSGLYPDPSGNLLQDLYGSTTTAGRRTDLDVRLIHTPKGAGAHVCWAAGFGVSRRSPGRRWSRSRG